MFHVNRLVARPSLVQFQHGYATKIPGSLPVHIYKTISSSQKPCTAFHFPDAEIILLRHSDHSAPDQYTFGSADDLKSEPVKKLEAPPYIIHCLRALKVQRQSAEEESRRILHYKTNISKGVDELVHEILDKGELE